MIQSQKTEELYFGYTSDLAKRIKRHNKGAVSSTEHAVPWIYIYIEGYRSKKDARARERKLKHYGNARTYLKKRTENSFLS